MGCAPECWRRGGKNALAKACAVWGDGERTGDWEAKTKLPESRSDGWELVEQPGDRWSNEKGKEMQGNEDEDK